MNKTEHTPSENRKPKILKRAFVIQTVALVALGIGLSDFFLIVPKDELKERSTYISSLKRAFVNSTDDNDALSKTLEASKSELELMKDIIAQMEQISGIEHKSNHSTLDRLTSISDYFVTKELDFSELDVRLSVIESRIGISLAETDASYPIEERIAIANLNSRQQEVLFRTIPNGYPIENSGVTSGFGKRTHPTTKLKSFHKGIDLKAASNTEVEATADGVIKRATFNKLSGNHIVVLHNFGFETHYSHLSEFRAKVGDIVQKGDLIGLSGNTGRSSGPHLHYEVRYINKPLNPLNFLTWEHGNQNLFSKERGIKWQSLISQINKQLVDPLPSSNPSPALQLSQVTPKSKAL